MSCHCQLTRRKGMENMRTFVLAVVMFAFVAFVVGVGLFL